MRNYLSAMPVPTDLLWPQPQSGEALRFQRQQIEATKMLTDGGAHRFAPPRSHPNAVARSKILDRLVDAGSTRVVVIHAPVGHGKTSLMLQAEAISRSKGALTRWLSLLDSVDNDARRFLGHLQGICDSLAPGVPERDDALPESEPVESNWLFRRISEIGEPIAIFLDDLHVITNPQTIGVLREFVLHGPPNLRWYIASRTVPDLALSRLLVNEEALIIRASDLRFSPDEARLFFERGSAGLTEPELEAIYETTEGWAAGLQLYRLTLQSPEIRSTLQNRPLSPPLQLAAYLAENVLARQSEECRGFLLKTSLLRQMSPALCDTVVGCDNSLAILRDLENSELFVRRLRSGDDWYTYHALFAHFLQDQARLILSAEEIHQVHLASANWNLSQGRLEEAIYHYGAIREFATAAGVLDTLSDKLVMDGQMLSLEYWADQIPFEYLRQRIGLVAKIAWALAFLLNRHDKLARLVQALKDAGEVKDASADPVLALCMVRLLEDDLRGAASMVASIGPEHATSDPFRIFEVGVACNARGYAEMAEGRFDAAMQRLAQGQELAERAGATFSWAYAIVKTGILLISRGGLLEAIVMLKRALYDPRMFANESISKACLTSAYIMALYEANELDLAMEQFVRFPDLAAKAFFHDYLFVAYTAIARIHDWNNEPQKALEIYDEAERLATAGRWNRIVTLLRWSRLHRALALGDFEHAKFIAQTLATPLVDSEDENWVRFSEETQSIVIGHLRYEIYLGNVKAALHKIDQLARAAERRGRLLRLIKLLVLSALAEDALGDRLASHRRLNQAVKLAASRRYIRVFLDEGERLISLLKDHREYVNAPGDQSPAAQASEVVFLDNLIRASDSAVARPVEIVTRSLSLVDSDQRLASFTSRERKCLSMLVNYYSNEQIAAGMFITKDTLKYHLKNIYGKLGVTSRLDAIRVARELGIK
jgi:LuxR family maltose regulon positive regulatory protein